MPPSGYIQQQVAELLRRGMAEARYGNRAAAAALLRRAVQLDPQNEPAWLWLGGVAAEPNEAAFALRAALELNPANAAARRGLSELEASGRLAPPAAPSARRSPDSSWRRQRQSRTTARSLGTMAWTFAVLLLVATIGLRVALMLQTPQAAPSPPRLVAKSVPVATPTSAPTPTPLPEPRATPVPFPTNTPRGAMMSYLQTLEKPRRALRDATESYLTTGDRRITAERAAATRVLRDAVQGAREQLEDVVPPSEARAAHQLYLDGLARETEALDDVLAFYADYNPARSNSAALRMQEARAAIDAAGKQWSALAARYGLRPETAGPR